MDALWATQWQQLLVLWTAVYDGRLSSGFNQTERKGNASWERIINPKLNLRGQSPGWSGQFRNTGAAQKRTARAAESKGK